ncbi:MAG: hypothetical protein ABS96_01550 [Lysobacteraceae bacterium SCN 69-123]|nr:MAG: hypothetical protein ABS96_01550 [Xanthomonadaceae bacterium SCN 69-123]
MTQSSHRHRIVLGRLRQQQSPAILKGGRRTELDTRNALRLLDRRTRLAFGIEGQHLSRGAQFKTRGSRQQGV